MKSKRSESAESVAAFEWRERVRWSDVDQAGIIYFGAYTRFIDVVECEFYRSIGYSYERFRQLELTMPRVHVDFDFFHPALLDDMLVLRLRVAGVGVHSVRFAIEISRETDDALLAEATMVTVCMGGDRKSATLPEAFAADLRGTMVPA